MSLLKKILSSSASERKRLTRVKINWLIRRAFLHRIERPVVRAFHRAYYHRTNTWEQNSWFGFPISQHPNDLYLYQEIIAKRKPDFIVQAGIFKGGSALFFAHMLDLVGAPDTAKVIAVDISITQEARKLSHPRIVLIEGDSTSAEVLRQIEDIVAQIPVVLGGMVSLDSDHAETHVAKELQLYPRFVGVGQYLVVEDTNVNNHPVLIEHGPGPREAVDKFLKTNQDFARDDALWQRQLFSFHQRGWLKRMK